MTDLSLTTAYITSLTGNPNTECDWRIINDRNKGEQAINLRGSFDSLAAQLTEYNNKGYGIFMTVNAMNATGPRTLDNIAAIRAHVVDIDDVLTAQDSYIRAVRSDMPPHFAVQTSQGKYHLYWLVEPYTGNEFYTQQQRKLIQLYNSDPNVTDATRVLRVPGFMHNKADPQLVNCWSIHTGPRYTFQQIADGLATVNVVEHIGNRKPLGAPELAAPSLELLNKALDMINPNDITREEWLGYTAAYKQAGWSLTTCDDLQSRWLEWCKKYAQDDVKENLKLWNSIKNSEVGWGRFERLTNIAAYRFLTPEQLNKSSGDNTDDLEGVNILDASLKQIWFKNCYFVESEGKIFSPTGRYMNQTQFNGRYGGKEFTLKPAGGKTTDEAWKAALRSTDWVILCNEYLRHLKTIRCLTII